MADFPKTVAPQYEAQQSSPWLPLNEAGRVWDAFTFATSVADRNLTAPPGSCADGARYLVAAAATGAWVGKENNIAVAVGVDAASGWLFVDAEVAGTEIYVVDEAIKIRWNGAAFVDVASSGLSFSWQVAASDQETELIAETPMVFEWPFDATLSAIHAFLRGGATSSDAVEVDILLNGASVFSPNLLTVDPGEQTSRTAVIAADLVTTAWSQGDVVSIQITGPGDGAFGLVITFEGVKG